MYIEQKEYLKIIQSLPISCVDIIIKNKNNEYLLVQRNSDPLKNHYFLVGGRVNLNETLLSAAKRKLNEEVGLNVDKFEFIGVYQDFFDRNSFGKCKIYHTISLVFLINIIGNEKIKLNKFSTSYKWSKELPKRFLENSYLLKEKL